MHRGRSLMLRLALLVLLMCWISWRDETGHHEGILPRHCKDILLQWTMIRSLVRLKAITIFANVYVSTDPGGTIDT